MTDGEWKRVACRVCGATDVALLCNNYNDHSRTRWLATYRCDACGSVFIGNRLDDSELAEAYATIDEAAYYGETAAASAPKFAKAARDLAGLAAPEAAILDIGGGHGAFVRALRAQGFGNLSIHEIPGADLPDLSPVVGRVFRNVDYGAIPTAAFDVVTLMDVLEHVTDVDATVAAAGRVLRPGGILYVHTPVASRLDRFMQAVLRWPCVDRLGRAWQRTRTSVFHLQNFTPRALRWLAERNGFAVASLDCINELSWPVDRYVRIYLVEKAGLPRLLAPPAVALLTPVLRSRLNLNKAVLVARLAGPASAKG